MSLEFQESGRTSATSQSSRSSVSSGNVLVSYFKPKVDVFILKGFRVHRHHWASAGNIGTNRFTISVVSGSDPNLVTPKVYQGFPSSTWAIGFDEPNGLPLLKNVTYRIVWEFTSASGLFRWGNSATSQTRGINFVDMGYVGNMYLNSIWCDEENTLYFDIKTAPPMKTRVSNTWREMESGYVKVNGVWREIVDIYTKISGVWKKSE